MELIRNLLRVAIAALRVGRAAIRERRSPVERTTPGWCRRASADLHPDVAVAPSCGCSDEICEIGWPSR